MTDFTPNRSLTTCDYGVELDLARAHLTSCGAPWGNSFAVWRGNDDQWAAYDAALREWREQHPYHDYWPALR